MTPELLKEITLLIEKFGFPVFVALCGLLLFVAVFRFMTKALEKKDCDFLAYIEKRDLAMEKRDAYIDTIVEKQNIAFRENTLAINQMRRSIDNRNEVIQNQTQFLKETLASSESNN